MMVCELSFPSPFVSLLEEIIAHCGLQMDHASHGRKNLQKHSKKSRLLLQDHLEALMLVHWVLHLPQHL